MLTHPLFEITGKTALVTGAGNGIGFSIAECLAENGARVVLTDISAQNLERAIKNLTERGFACSGEILDVAKKKDVVAVVDNIARQHESLDIVFANAGISAGPGPFTDVGNIEAVQDEKWTQVLDINLNGVFSTMQAAAKHMKKQRSGRIVVTASTAGARADRMVGYAYSATKAAVTNLVRQAAIELARHNVHVNGIAPGPFRTNIGGGRMENPATERSFAEVLPLDRIGKPDEIKGVALLLASPASSFMTGAIIPVDGGALAW